MYQKNGNLKTFSLIKTKHKTSTNPYIPLSLGITWVSPGSHQTISKKIAQVFINKKWTKSPAFHPRLTKDSDPSFVQNLWSKL